MQHTQATQPQSPITHLGEVIAHQGHQVLVRIHQQSACATCAAAHLCRTSESRERVMRVPLADATLFPVGSRVRLRVDERRGLQASAVAYMAPVLMVLAVLVGVHMAGLSDVIAAAGCVVALFLYFGVLYLLRARLARRFQVSIEKVE